MVQYIFKRTGLRIMNEKKGDETKKVVLAVTSIIIIMTIFATVLILSGRTVVTGNALILNPLTQETTIIQENPCQLLRCMGWQQPVLLGYEGMQIYNQYARCVCAYVKNGEVFYDELQIKKIKTTRAY